MPTRKITWAESASRELTKIGDYIAEDNRPAARRVVKAIRVSAASLSTFPFGGHAGKVPGTREFVVPGLPYIVVYEVIDGRVYVQRVRHGAQLYPPS